MNNSQDTTKNRSEIISEIVASLEFDSGDERAAAVLGQTYAMPVELTDGEVHFEESGIILPREIFRGFMEEIIRSSSDEELLENYGMLTGRDWTWAMVSEESDVQPEKIAITGLKQKGEGDV
jgi:hypothetical protein